MDRNQVRKILRRFLQEDIGCCDVTGEAVFSTHDTGSLQFIAGGEYVAAGLEAVISEIFRLQNSSIIAIDPVADGTRTMEGMRLLTVSGPTIDLLKAEQVSRNVFKRMAGVATLTSTLVERAKVFKVALTDSRDTTPGLRLFERYAHRVGGGINGRGSLAEGILVTREHIVSCGSLQEVVQRVRSRAPVNFHVEVLVDSLDLVDECLLCDVDIVQLGENMSLQDMAEAVKITRNVLKTEVCLGGKPDRLETLAMTGVDFIAIGDISGLIPSCQVNVDWSF